MNNGMIGDNGAVRANLFWDGTGRDNCWKDNLFVDEMGGSSVPPPDELPVCSEETNLPANVENEAPEIAGRPEDHRRGPQVVGILLRDRLPPGAVLVEPPHAVDAPAY